MRKHADKGARKGPKKFWPAWRYGPALVEGGEVQARIFDKPEDVPDGWVAHPEELKVKAAPLPAPTEAAAPKSRKKGAPAAPPAPTAEEAERAHLVADLKAKGYADDVLANASIDELRATMKAEVDDSNQ